MNRNWNLPRLCLGMLVLLVAGCGSGSDTAPVKGRVTLDGSPLEMVDIVFQPTNRDPPSTGRTDADGNYALMYKRGVQGARLGEHEVRIGYTSNIVKNPPNIPAKYNTASEFKREVKSGGNEFDFDLKSDGK